MCACTRVFGTKEEAAGGKMSYVRHTTVAAVCLPVLVIILWVPALEVSCCVHMFSGLLLLLSCVLISDRLFTLL